MLWICIFAEVDMLSNECLCAWCHKVNRIFLRKMCSIWKVFNIWMCHIYRNNKRTTRSILINRRTDQKCWENGMSFALKIIHSQNICKFHTSVRFTLSILMTYDLCPIIKFSYLYTSDTVAEKITTTTKNKRLHCC